MEINQNEKPARKLAIVFVAFVLAVTVGVLGAIVLSPYDTGILSGASLSGNNQYGGELTVTNDYLFYLQKGAIMRQQRGGEELETVYQGNVSYLNPFDGWLYFLQNGCIYRTTYYGGMVTQMGTAQNVKSMSVNGLWIYYLTQNGELFKMRTDGEQLFQLSNGSVKFTAFEAANRIILATDGKNIYRMKMDGTACSVLREGKNITRMLYTLDNLFYCDNGEVLQVKSVEANQNDGTTYGGITADIFTYNINAENRGCVYYVKGEELRVRKLQSIQHAQEEDVFLTKVPDITDLYSVDGDLYYHDKAGNLFFVRINEAETTVETMSPTNTAK